VFVLELSSESRRNEGSVGRETRPAMARVEEIGEVIVDELPPFQVTRKRRW